MWTSIAALFVFGIMGFVLGTVFGYRRGRYDGEAHGYLVGRKGLFDE